MSCEVSGEVNGRVRRVGCVVRKGLGALPASHGRRIEHLARVVRARGLRTPSARYDAATHELEFPWIEGASGRMLVRAGRFATRASAAACIEPLVVLHEIECSDLPLSPLDPWRHIHPRLAAARATVARPARKAASALANVFDAASVWAARRPCSVVHGDYHVGQLILDAVDGAPWLVDLDDLALGPAESDVGNVLAHLLTTDKPAPASMQLGYAHESSTVLETYLQRRGVPLDATLVSRFVALALLRRALKLDERGESESLVLAALALSYEVATSP